MMGRVNEVPSLYTTPGPQPDRAFKGLLCSPSLKERKDALTQDWSEPTGFSN